MLRNISPADPFLSDVSGDWNSESAQSETEVPSCGILLSRISDSFLQELELSAEDRADADGKANRIARSLFGSYYPDQPFDPSCYVKVGSYGKETACSACTDLDMLFVLPLHEFLRIDRLAGNKQSQLLREVKDNLFWTFPRTDLKADGQIVDVPFATYHLEVVPVFRLSDGSFLTPHTARDGSWRISNPVAEFAQLNRVDQAWQWKATHLTKMLKAWKYECNVPIKSNSLEVLATVFVEQWQHRQYGIYFYDWMMRDFFAFMLNYENGWTLVTGTTERIELGDCWVSKCRSAYQRALKACEYEKMDWPCSATGQWQSIFGTHFKGSSSSLVQALAFA